MLRLPFLLIVLVLPSLANAQASPPPMPISIDPVIRSAIDIHPRLSADGKTLVWIRCRDSKLTLCVARSPMTSRPREVSLGRAQSPLPRICLSLDGRHVFGQDEGKVWHCPIDEKSKLGAVEQLPVRSGPFGLTTNRDGTVLATLVDGPSSADISPSYRAVSTATLNKDGWQQDEPLTSVEKGKLAWGLLLDGPGRYMLFELDGIRQATRKPDLNNENGWAIKDLRFNGYNLRPAALSEDGQTLLLRGRRTDEKPTRDELVNLSHIWTAHRADGAWTEPRLVMRDQMINYYNCAMSPDGSRLMWVEFKRDEKMKILKTRLRCMQLQEGDRSAKQETLVEQDGFLKFWETAIANDGTAAWSTVAGGIWRGYVRPVGKETIALTKKSSSE